MTRRFHLLRHADETGISGTGVVAEGALFTNGKAVVSWLTSVSSVAVYDSIEAVVAIHGHNGKTEVVWVDPYQTCASCKHWDKDDSGPLRACSRVLTKDSPKPMTAPYILNVGTGSAHALGSLMVPADFGCNRWEKNTRCQTCNGREVVMEPFGPCPTCQQKESKA
jgi:hypothetical protein